MFSLNPLRYAQDALEPVISAKTLEFHHGKHLATYVENLNRLIVNTEFEDMSLEDIVCHATGNIFNNAGQVLNHNMYFEQFKPMEVLPEGVLPGDTEGTLISEPTGLLRAQILRQWTSIDMFKSLMVSAGTSLFGSGWVFLSAGPDGYLYITQEAGGYNPIRRKMPGSTQIPGLPPYLTPLLTFDVWEHAYYLDYQNRRAAYLESLWKIIDWNVVADRYFHAVV